MEMPDVEKINRDELIEVMCRRAAAYTPEWRFDKEYSDIGTALVLLFADMMNGTEKHLAGVSERYRLHFYDLLGAKQLPAQEAKGYVSFTTVSDEVSGTFLEAGERLQGTTPDNGTSVFETEKELYVSPARLRKVIGADGDADYISGSLDFPIRFQGGEDSGRLCGVTAPAENEQPHILYIGQDTMLSIDTEGELVLDFHLSPDGRSRKLSQLLREHISWSYYSQDGFVRFAETRCEGGQVFLRKASSQPPFMQMEYHGIKSRWIRAEADALLPQSCVRFEALSMRGSGSHLAPEVVFDGEAELEAEDFFPFGEYPYPFAGLYIGSEEVFSKRGAYVELEFELFFEKIPGEIKSPEIPVNWRNIMRQSEFERPEPPDIVISSVIWEYYNGSGWRRLPVDARYGRIFDGGADTGQHGQQHILLRFICPEDIYPFLLAGQEGCCIRVRVLQMADLYTPDGIYITPRIKNLLLSYRYEREEAYPVCAFAENQMEIRPLDCRRDFIPFYNRLPAGRMLGLCFSAPLNERGIRLLFLIQKGSVREGVPYQFEYYGVDGWKPLKIVDETENLSHTGLVTLNGEHEFVERKIGNTSGYWIRVVRREGEFPVIRGIIPNSVLASACSGSGIAGNLPPGSVDTMERSIGFVNEVSNPENMTGGCEEESSQQAVKRFAATMRHRGRAVTAKDFEDIVCSGVRNLSQIRCFPGRDETGKRAPGHITLAVFAGLDETEERFDYLEQNILQCLRPHMDDRLYREGKLHIVETIRVPFFLYMTVYVRESACFEPLREKIGKRIDEFLDPVTGNFDRCGWRIGTLPTVLQIENLCSQMEEVLYISNISLRDERDYGRYVLAAGGEYEIEMIPQ